MAKFLWIVVNQCFLHFCIFHWLLDWPQSSFWPSHVLKTTLLKTVSMLFYSGHFFVFISLLLPLLKIFFSWPPWCHSWLKDFFRGMLPLNPLGSSSLLNSEVEGPNLGSFTLLPLNSILRGQPPFPRAWITSLGLWVHFPLTEVFPNKPLECLIPS